MNEIEAIIRTFQDLPEGERAALATVVKVEGSAYRRPGARMLITSGGITVGTISGGCLESDVRERAHRILQGGDAVVVRYDSTSDADGLFGLGLGCNGIVHVLIEPVLVGDPHGPIAFLAGARQSGHEAVMATVIASDIQGVRAGMRLWSDRDEHVNGNIELAEVVQLLNAEMRAAVGTRRAAVRSLDLPEGRVEALIEVVAPPTRLVLFGAGHDAQPLAQFARQLGWHVTVADHRPAFATTDRFPTVQQVVCASPDEMVFRAAVNGATVAIIMTHHLEHDRLLLRSLLPLPLRYLGILGPRARTERLLNEIEAEGLVLDPCWLERLHSPAGLDLGAETPEEIALSILAEMQATLTGRSGGRLKDHNGPIHGGPETA
jgi:xanthine/CO dehydrogenase XdhC/CoxF family maturation factor